MKYSQDDSKPKLIHFEYWVKDYARNYPKLHHLFEIKEELAYEAFKEKTFIPMINQIKKYGVNFCIQRSTFYVKKNGDKVEIKYAVCSHKIEKQKNAKKKQN